MGGVRARADRPLSWGVYQGWRGGRRSRERAAAVTISRCYNRYACPEHIVITITNLHIEIIGGDTIIEVGIRINIMSIIFILSIFL